MRNTQRNRDFEALYRAHYDFIWRSAIRLGVPPASLEDVLQETFLIAYDRLAGFEARAKVSTWLFSILRNVWRNHRRGRLRSERKHNALADERERVEALHGEATKLETQRLLADRLLTEFLAGLDERKREVFVLAELEGMNRREIAAALEINVNTVQSRLRAARAAFERHFSRDHVVSRLRDSLSERPPRAPAQARKRSRALLMATLDPASPALLGGLGGLGLAKLFAAAVALAAGFAALMLLGREERTRTQPPTRHVVGPAEPSRAPRVEQPTSDEPIDVVATTAPNTAGARAARPRRPTPSKVNDGRTPAGDYQRFEAAREALVSGRPAEALSLVEPLDAGGELGWERAVTEVAALCRLDRRAEALDVAAQWNAREDTRTIIAPCE